MQTNVVFKNDDKPWTREEDMRIKKLYNEHSLTVIEISKIYDRSPDNIIYRLNKYNCIGDDHIPRGCTPRVVSNEEEKVIHVNKIKNKMFEEAWRDKSDKSDYNELCNEVKEMRNEIKVLKKYIEVLIEMMSSKE